ncbi:hypothetical protein ACIPPS_00080 [Streptomyces sp. NPDC090127]|uniref:hypothetical protein n=1 Tax=Streptomyces sp. NPDC090127 TaxID=3365953 RepID=UPI0038114C65
MIRTKKTALGGAASAVLLAAALVGCASDEGAGVGALSLERLALIADELGKDGAKECPLPYDAGKAGEAAGLDQSILAGAAGAEATDPSATADGGTVTDPRSVFAGKTGAFITCSYQVGGEDLNIYTVGTEEGNAVYAMAPRMQYDGSMGPDELTVNIEKGAKAELGKAVQSKSGNVVTVRLDPDGKGDIALMLAAGDSGETSLEPQQVLRLAEAFAAQAK